MKRGWEAKFLELIVWGSVLVEEMHTPEKKYHFSKKNRLRWATIL